MYKLVAPGSNIILFIIWAYKWSVINKNFWFAPWEAVKSEV